MPVENPGDETGIALHFVDQAPGFLAAIDSGREPRFDGSVSLRTEYLSNETKDELDDGFATPRRYWG